MGFYSNPSAGGAGQAVKTISSQSASFTAAANYLYNVSASSGIVTVTLPASSSGQSIVVRKNDSSSNSVTLSGTLNGTSGTITLSKQNQSKEIYADGSGGWLSMAGDIDPVTLASTSSSVGFPTATGFANITIGTVAPSSPAIGDIWIDTN